MDKYNLLKTVYKGTGNKTPTFQQIDGDSVLFLAKDHYKWYLIVNHDVAIYNNCKCSIVKLEDIYNELLSCNVVSLKREEYSNTVCRLLQYYKSHQETTWTYQGKKYKAVEYNWNSRKDGDLVCLHKYYFTTYRTRGKYCVLPYVYEVKGNNLYDLQANKSIIHFDYTSFKIYLNKQHYTGYDEIPTSSFSLSPFEINLIKQPQIICN